MKRNPVDTYGFINAKLRGRIGRMREDQLVENLLRASTLVDAIALLRDSPYKQVAEVYDRTGDLQQMELVLLASEIEGHRLIAKHMGGRSLRLVEHLLAKIELDNLKNTLRLWYSAIIRRRPIRFRSEYLFKEQIVHPIQWVALINTTAWSEVQQLLADTPYGPTIALFSEQQLIEDGLFGLESALDRGWYAELLQVSETLRKNDQAVAQEIFGAEIDLKNLQTLVRYGLYYQKPAEELAALLLPWGRVAESTAAALYIASEPESRDAVALINTFYRGVGESKAVGATTGEPGVAENLLLEGYLVERRRAFYRRVLGGDPFTVGVILAFLFLFTEETATIRATLNGKYYGYEEAYIRGVLG